MSTLVSRPKGRFSWSEALSLVAVALLALLVLKQPTVQVVVHDEVVTGSIQITVRPASKELTAFEKEELECLERNIYFEARGLPVFHQAMKAYVTLNRVRANKSYWGGNTICGVVYHQIVHKSGRAVAMFSWTNLWPWGTKPKMADEVARLTAAFIARYVWEGKFIPPDHLVGADHFLNPRTSEPRNVCEFQRNLIPLEQEADHHYYRSPKNELDRLVLASQPVSAPCQKSQKIASR